MRLSHQLIFLIILIPLTTTLVVGETIRVASYNLRNYLTMDRMVQGVWRPEYPKPEVEKRALRAVIVAAGPDILCVQEMGTLPYLKELQADLKLEGLHYPYAVHLQAADSERHIALLSKYEPIRVKKHTDLEFKYLNGRERVKRGLLEASFELGQSTFTLFGVHLKSPWSDQVDDPNSELRRTREAEACRNRVVERTLERGAADYLILGDFNDHPNSSAMRRFYQRGDLMIGTRLPVSDGRGEVWTYFYEREATYRAVDGFILSEQLWPRVSSGQGAISDGPEVMIGSDHRMIWVDLIF